MKKAKIMLAAIVVLAIGSGVFAANAKKFNVQYFTDPAGVCSVTATGLVITDQFHGQAANISATSLTSACPATQVLSAE